MTSKAVRARQLAKLFVLSAILVAIMLLALSCGGSKPEEVNPIDVQKFDYGVSDITSTSATIYWSTDIPSMSSVGIALSLNGAITWLPEDETMTMQHRVTLDSLSPNTTYYYALNSRANLKSWPRISYICTPFTTLP